MDNQQDYCWSLHSVVTSSFAARIADSGNMFRPKSSKWHFCPNGKMEVTHGPRPSPRETRAWTKTHKKQNHSLYYWFTTTNDRVPSRLYSGKGMELRRVDFFFKSNGSTPRPNAGEHSFVVILYLWKLAWSQGSTQSSQPSPIWGPWVLSLRFPSSSRLWPLLPLFAFSFPFNCPRDPHVYLSRAIFGPDCILYTSTKHRMGIFGFH